MGLPFCRGRTRPVRGARGVGSLTFACRNTGCSRVCGESFHHLRAAPSHEALLFPATDARDRCSRLMHLGPKTPKPCSSNLTQTLTNTGMGQPSPLLTAFAIPGHISAPVMQLPTAARVAAATRASTAVMAVDDLASWRRRRRRRQQRGPWTRDSRASTAARWRTHGSRGQRSTSVSLVTGQAGATTQKAPSNAYHQHRRWRVIRN